MFYIREENDRIILSILSSDNCKLTDIEMTYEQAADLALEILFRHDKVKNTLPRKLVLNDEGESKIVGLGHPQLVFNPTGKKQESVFSHLIKPIATETGNDPNDP